MLMAKVLFTQMCSLFANNPATFVLNEDTASVRVIVSPFVPGLNLSLGDLTLRSDNLSNSGISLKPEVGPDMLYDCDSGERLSHHSFDDGQQDHFETQTLPSAPFTVYGFALVTVDNALLAVEPLAVPRVVSRAGELVGAYFPEFRFPLTMVR